MSGGVSTGRTLTDNCEILAEVREAGLLGAPYCRQHTNFLTDMKADFPAFNRLYAEHFATNRPTRTTVEVGALPTPIDVELKVIAYVSR
jgi:enamine deaminase RidA (YjgF/YER057c/UK114 family)